jgi:hypothetical protein
VKLGRLNHITIIKQSKSFDFRGWINMQPFRKALLFNTVICLTIASCTHPPKTNLAKDEAATMSIYKTSDSMPIDKNDGSAADAVKFNAGNKKETGHYFGYGLKYEGIEDCSKIEKEEGPIGFKGCVGHNVDIAEQHLNSAHSQSNKVAKTKLLKNWKDRAYKECEKWADADGWSGGTGYSLAVDDCYGKKILNKIKELNESSETK